MSFQDIKENAEAIQENTKAYIETSLKYYKLWGFKIVMKSTSLLLKFFLIAICFIVVLFFISLALAFALGAYFDNYAIGFLIVALLYLVLAFILYLVRFNFLKLYLLNKFSEIFFND